MPGKILTHKTANRPNDNEDEHQSTVLPKNSTMIPPDPRYPIFLSFWKRRQSNHLGQIPGPAMDIYDEPHFKRRLVILRKYPEMTKLYGTDIRSALIFLLSFIVHVYFTFSFSFGSWKNTHLAIFLLTAFWIGGSITQLAGILIHEATHNLVFAGNSANIFFAFLVNLLLPVPIAMSFRRYHLLHHQHQGIKSLDPDLPLDCEYKIIKSNNFFLKFIWISLFPVLYLLRGTALHLKPSLLEATNLLTVFFTTLGVFYIGGWKSLAYYALSCYSGYSFHPGAAHFIQEHFTWKDGQETYSYYGVFNRIFMNIGFHNEHHDFTKISWSRLPEVTKIAPEFYDPMKSHSSWIKVFWQFLTQPDLGPQSRVERSKADHDHARALPAFPPN